MPGTGPTSHALVAFGRPAPRSNRSGPVNGRRPAPDHLGALFSSHKTVMGAFDAGVPREMLAKKRGSADAADGDGLPMNLRHIQTGATGTSTIRKQVWRLSDPGHRHLRRSASTAAALLSALAMSAGYGARPALAAAARVTAPAQAAVTATVDPAVPVAGEPNFGPNVYVFTQHAAEPDPGHRRRHFSPADLQPVRYPALRPAVRARYLRLSRGSAFLPGGLLHRGSGPRQLTW